MSTKKEHFSRRSTLFIFLSAIFLTTAVVAEIIGVKIFSVEAMLGIPPAQIPLFNGNKLDFNLSTGVIIWPIVFVLSDIINEYFGRAGVKKISFMGAGFIGYAFIMIFVATMLPPTPFWVTNNQAACGGGFDINCAFNKIFSQGLSMIIASLTAFLIGQFLDAYVFYLLKKKWASSKNIWIRATGSTLISQLFDSFIVLTIAFYVCGNWSFKQVISVGIVQYVFKMIATFALIPMLYLAHKVINKYLGKELAEEMIKDDITKK